MSTRAPEPGVDDTRAEHAPGPPIETTPGPRRGVKAMSIVRWVLVLATALVAAGSILSAAGVHAGKAGGGPSHQLYACPMHPSVVQDHPGECPICSMTLVPKPATKPTPTPTPTPPAPTSATTTEGAAAGMPAAGNAEVAGLAAVDLTADRIQLIGMRTATVKREALGGELRTVGIVAANERGLAQINTRFAGWIQKLLVSETGARVRRGQPLATIYSPDVLRAEQELLVARGWNTGGDSASNALDGSARRRLELLGISAQEIDEMVRAGKAVDAVAIRSPVDGYVIAKNAVAGMAVQPGTVLFEVADLSRVWVTADVYERDVSHVKVGQRARLELASFPGEMHPGRVQFIYPTLDAGNRTLTIRLELQNRFDRNGPLLKPGMYGTVYLDLPSTTGLVVPADAVVDTGETHYLFVAKPGGRFEPRRIEIGARLKDRVEITSGVAEGETVVTTGNFLVDSESRLRAAIDGQTSPQAASAAAPPTGR